MPKISKKAAGANSGGPVATSFDEQALIKKMADNSRPVREKALKALSQYLSTPKTLDELKLKKLCKGLFYAMWYCDRPVTQQNLAAEIASLTERVKPKNYWVFVSAFWAVMIREWQSIDSHRINKFYLLIRRFLFALLTHLNACEWSEKELESYLEVMTAGPLNPVDPKVPHAIRLHVCDIYLDEIERLRETNEDLPYDQLLAPIEVLSSSADFKIVKARAAQVLAEPVLVEWGVKEAPQEPESESEDDWEGFD